MANNYVDLDVFIETLDFSLFVGFDCDLKINDGPLLLGPAGEVVLNVGDRFYSLYSREDKKGSAGSPAIDLAPGWVYEYKGFVVVDDGRDVNLALFDAIELSTKESTCKYLASKSGLKNNYLGFYHSRSEFLGVKNSFSQLHWYTPQVSARGQLCKFIDRV